MTLSSLDWTIVGAYFLLSLAVGIWASKQAGKDTRSFFPGRAEHALVAFGSEYGSNHLFYRYSQLGN